MISSQSFGTIKNDQTSVCLGAQHPPKKSRAMKPDSDCCDKSMVMPLTNEMNVSIAMLVTRVSPAHETLAQDLSVAAAQLIEAACRARGGDCEASRAHVKHAMALLRGMPSLGPQYANQLSSVGTLIVRGSLPAWKMRKVISHVEAHLSRRVHVKELAGLVGLSASHFCRAFKCAFGASPRAYILHRRIEVAQAMMLTTAEPFRSIAMSCGMCDQQHFTRSFRRIVGETPSMWRHTRRESMAKSGNFAQTIS
jgi:AraC family transcriptional regulator